MRALLRNILRSECNKLIARHDEYLYELDKTIKRRRKRLGHDVAKTVKVPAYWALDGRFNPFKVRIDKNLDRYSHALNRRLLDGSYAPSTAVVHRIPKDKGGERELNIFQIPDAAVSRMVYKSLLRKNVGLMSSYSYAYREDREAHDAVRHISSEWRSSDRVYVAEFDFSRFFDCIGHDHLWKTMERVGFYCSPIEERVLNAFLQSRFSDLETYDSSGGLPRDKGIPQGTSVSLFLANVACWDLDRRLERLGVGFTRYADDTLVWSSDYSKVVKAFDLITECGRIMGVPLNLDKSEGIALVTAHGDAEIRSKQSVEYLGYRVGLGHTSIGTKHVVKLKARISYLIYENLLQPLQSGIFNDSRITGADWDYIVALAQVRRYLYGGLTDQKLFQYIKGVVPKLNFRGLMSYYPLVDDDSQLANLDGWLIHSFRQAMHKRQKLWLARGLSLPGPCSNWIEKLTELRSWTIGGTRYDMRVPSLSLINKAMRLALVSTGVAGVAHPKSSYY